VHLNPLTIPAAIYGGIITVRNLAYDLRPGLSHRVPAPVICIGNLTTGGTGKTPMTACLAQHLSRQGFHPAIISRGYGRRQEKETRWLGPGNPPDSRSPELYGDEALMLHRQLPQIPIVLDGDRLRAARTAIRNFRTDLILMDDGFQHRRLHRDFNLLMIDSQRMFGNRRLLPAGPLREPLLTALERADAVVFNKFDARHPRFLEEAAPVFTRVPARRIFRSRYIVRDFTNPLSQVPLSAEQLRDITPLVACAGLGNNDYFFSQLHRLGINPEKTVPFRDHHAYDQGDLLRLKRLTKPAGRLLTTAKDAVKLIRLGRKMREQEFLNRLLVLEIELEIDRPDAFFRLFQSLVKT